MFLVIGSGPLPFEKGISHSAGGLRTVQFLQPILGHREKFVLVTIGESGEKTIYLDSENVWLKISKDEALNFASLNKLIDEVLHGEEINGIIGVNTFPSFVATNLGRGEPLWTDLNGWIMAEGVSQAQTMKDDGLMSHYFGMEKKILEMADFISTVSGRQKWATYGEMMSLGLIGRNCREDFIYEVPNAQLLTRKISNKDCDYLYEKYGLPDDKFLILSAGGFNTWLDIDTMFSGMEEAIKKDPNIHFVSTGGAIKNLDDNVYNRFVRMVEKSEVKANFHLLGWIEKEDVLNLYGICHLGINIDRWNIETATGARNRITEMMLQKIPVLMTEGTEISSIIKDKELGFVVPIGEAVTLASELIRIANVESPVLDGFASEAFDYASKYFSPNHVLEGFEKWMREPRKRIRDKINVGNMSKVQLVSKGIRSLKDKGISETFVYVKRYWRKLFK